MRCVEPIAVTSVDARLIERSFIYLKVLPALWMK